MSLEPVKAVLKLSYIGSVIFARWEAAQHKLPAYSLLILRRQIAAHRL